MERTPRENPTHVVDLARPLSKEAKKDIAMKENDSCFGLEWDNADNNCAICADNELCCIFHRSVVDKKSKSIEKARGIFYLDRTDFENIDKEKLLFQIDLKSGTMTSAELIDYLKNEAKTSDDVAVVEWLKEFKKESGKFSIKEGLVYFKK